MRSSQKVGNLLVVPKKENTYKGMGSEARYKDHEDVSVKQINANPVIWVSLPDVIGGVMHRRLHGRASNV